jgi:diacylglycerol O-acyltransferase / wax synthase
MTTDTEQADTRHGGREPMSKVDTAWLRMERPTNLMMITGVMMLADPLDIERFKRILHERFLAFRRFRQKAVDGAGGAHWEIDEDFDLEWHVRVAALPGKAGRAELQRLCSELASTPLDNSRPRWQFHVVERYGQGSALITRVHHCYADGVALIEVLLSLTDVKPGVEDKAALAKAWFNEDRGAVVERLEAPVRQGFSKALHMGETLIEKVREVLDEPEKLGHLVHEGSEIARELLHALRLPDDPPTRFRGPLGIGKRCAWAEPMPIDEVKIIGKALGCTVNDVLMACAAGALRSYLIEKGSDPNGLDIRATVPVNLRPLEHAKKLGNQFGLVFLTLPIGEANPLRRLERIAENMREIKRSRQAIMAFGLLAAIGMGPAAVQGPALEMFSRKATAVATNVPGPQMPLYFAGSRIEDQMFWVPQTGSIGMGISILSYNGRVHFGLMTDAKLVPDPEHIIGRFAAEFEKLLLLTLMEDWDEDITAGGASMTLSHFQLEQAAVLAPNTTRIAKVKSAPALRKPPLGRKSPGKRNARRSSIWPE